MLMGMLCIAWLPLYFRHCNDEYKLLAYWYFYTITFDALAIISSRTYFHDSNVSLLLSHVRLLLRFQ